ncbi:MULTISPECIES: hypothetical protein [Bombella]|uniref:Uncharacterized protein n=1 Tax=Bombella pollinis TaxID=2967337 RepID=A0ABT3WKM1_9PROT|nr:MULTISPECIES: hypothetical protein [Bombella]MCT6855821.1 hypothetical protein [Bombella apis]MCX5619644.1 hypothetical protein [Bombella pollinis]MUG04353.1 hypothetical protein [Bombella sp. ESL0378]MUG89846.1 hypothetical protein [Bombella sp. ESL0385]
MSRSHYNAAQRLKRKGRIMLIGIRLVSMAQIIASGKRGVIVCIVRYGL